MWEPAGRRGKTWGEAGEASEATQGGARDRVDAGSWGEPGDAQPRTFMSRGCIGVRVCYQAK